MARKLSGNIVWTDPKITSSTPQKPVHVNEIQTNINSITDDFNVHKGSNGFEAHLEVTAMEDGFITPDMVQKLKDLNAKLDAAISRVQTRIPIGTIIPYYGTVAAIPTGWELVTSTTSTSDFGDRSFYGKGPSTTLHASGGSTTAFVPASALPRHRHWFNNITWCETHRDYGKYYVSPTYPYPKVGQTIGCSDPDNDNPYELYLWDTTAGPNTGTEEGRTVNVESPYVKKLFIIKTGVGA